MKSPKSPSQSKRNLSNSRNPKSTNAPFIRAATALKLVVRKALPDNPVTKASPTDWLASGNTTAMEVKAMERDMTSEAVAPRACTVPTMTSVKKAR